MKFWATAIGNLNKPIAFSKYDECFGRPFADGSIATLYFASFSLPAKNCKERGIKKKTTSFLATTKIHPVNKLPAMVIQTALFAVRHRLSNLQKQKKRNHIRILKVSCLTALTGY